VHISISNKVVIKSQDISFGMDINKTIKLALEHFQAGNLQQAENICKEILNVQSNNITA
jgi:hypothetical protein